MNNLIIKNYLTKINDILAKSHVIYEIKCPAGDCELPNPTYIGHTGNNVCTRLNQHRQSGAIIEQLATHHNRFSLPLDEIQQHISILKMLTETNKFLFNTIIHNNTFY